VLSQHGSGFGIPPVNDASVIVTKFDTNGNFQWERQFNSSGHDRPSSIFTDSRGFTYVGGTTGGNLGGANSGADDVFVLKLDSSGNLIWSGQFGTSANDVAYGVTADGLGSVYLTGYTEGDFGGIHAGGADIYVAKIIEVPEPATAMGVLWVVLLISSFLRHRRHL